VTRIRGDELLALGLPQGPALGVALNALPKAVKRLGREQALAELKDVVPLVDKEARARQAASATRRGTGEKGEAPDRARR
jgi:tRNA-splicing ligase RtcB